MKKLLYTLSLGLLIAGCSSETKNAGNGLSIEFEGRTIDIAPYYKDFPYQYFNISKDGKTLLFFKTGDEQKLQTIDIAPGADIRNASDVTDWNFAQRNCWSPTYNGFDGKVYWIGDEKNDEIINLYRTTPGSGEVEKLTDVPYIYAWSFNPDGSKVAYVARVQQSADNRLDELHILDLQSLNDDLVCNDEGSQFPFTWGDVSWQPEGKGLLVLGLKDMDRTYTNVLYIDLASKKTKVLTDPDKEGSLSGTMVFPEWFSADEAIYLSDQDGYNNLYSYRLSTDKVEQLTSFTMSLDKAESIRLEGKNYILALQSNPIESKLLLFDPEKKEVVVEQSSPLALSLGTVVGSEAYLSAAGTTTLFQILKAKVTTSGISFENIMQTPDDLQAKLVHSTVERLEIPTFDTDPATGKQRILHAYLFKPENPLPANKGMLMVESFYGGMNSYASDYQIYTQAGIYVLSAAPRGSAGFGREFAALNDKDLGGNETIDMIYATKYVADKLGIPANRVGAFGTSHGGYETMRLLTFPGEVNGTEASFPFGFGVAIAGFCDIRWQMFHCNIPDWITLEAGSDSLRQAERSPINYADKITGPLLLAHGTNDHRVDPAGSTDMANKLKELGKPYEYMQFEGLGHGIKGAENNLRFYTHLFDFLENRVLK